MKKLFSLLICLSFITLSAQVSISSLGTAYFQDFNSLPSSGSGPAWSNNVTFPGWYSNEGFIYPDDGNDAFGGRLYSYGTVSSTERALGGTSFSSAAGTAFAVRMKNNTGGSISYFQVAFRGEQWKQNVSNLTLKFYYQLNATGISSGTWNPVTALDFATLYTGSAMPLDGNLPANDSAFVYALPVTVNTSEEIWFKWEIKGNNQSPGLAIDDLEIIPYTSDPTAVTAENPGKNCLSVSYFSAMQAASVRLYSEKSEKIIIAIYNLTGDKLSISSHFTAKGENYFSISAGPFANGVYFLTVQNEKDFYINKFFIQKP